MLSRGAPDGEEPTGTCLEGASSHSCGLPRVRVDVLLINQDGVGYADAGKVAYFGPASLLL